MVALASCRAVSGPGGHFSVSGVCSRASLCARLRHVLHSPSYVILKGPSEQEHGGLPSQGVTGLDLNPGLAAPDSCLDASFLVIPY